jgi:cobalamin-dependent methionine synthase I
MKAILPLAAESGALLLALAMDDRGLPETAERRVEVATAIVAVAEKLGIDRGRVYVDPCIQPLSTNPAQAEAVRTAIGRIMQSLPGVHTTCGLSNISFGLPGRGLLNCTYLAGLIAAGLDSAILDPTAEGIMDTVRAAEALAGRDEFCMNYIRSMRTQQSLRTQQG